MGRMVIILIIGFGVALGVTSRTITRRLTEAVENATAYTSGTNAKNIASSAVEVYVRKMKTGTAGVGTYAMNMMGGSAEVTISSADASSAAKPDTFNLTAVGKFQKFQDTISVILAGNMSTPAIPINGALGVSAGTKINFATGSNDTISGYNHDQYGNLSSSCSDVHGLVYKQSGDLTASGLNTQVKGVGSYVPDTCLVNDQPDYTALVNQIIPLADTVISSNTTTAPLTLGTPSNPRITYVNGGVTFHGPTTGAGILIINPGDGTWQTSLPFTWTGLIFVVGSGTKAQLKFGREATVIGAMVMSGTQAKIDMAAGSYVQTIKYSCEAIGMAYGLVSSTGNYIIYDWWE